MDRVPDCLIVLACYATRILLRSYCLRCSELCLSRLFQPLFCWVSAYFMFFLSFETDHILFQKAILVCFGRQAEIITNSRLNVLSRAR